MTQPHLAETLQVHEGLVRGLARGVLGLDDRVDDVVQETWRTALEKAPRDPSRLRAWLAAVARNRALTILRRDKARRRYERALPSRAPAPSAAEIAEREETRRRLVHALLHQPEPYRRTLLLRYYEDCRVAEIARRMDVSRETVKTRLRRGLERLRAELDGGDGRRLALLVPLALGRPASALAIAGGMVVGTKVKLGFVAILLLALLATVGYRMRGEERGGRSVTRVAARDTGVEETQAPANGRDAGPSTERVSRTPVSPRRSRITGTVTTADGVPIADAEIRARIPHARSARTDATGAYALDGMPFGSYPLQVSAAGYASLVKQTDVQTNEIHVGFVMKQSTPLFGRVVDQEGAPVAGARLFASLASDERTRLPERQTDPDGAFRFDDAYRGGWWLRLTPPAPTGAWQGARELLVESAECPLTLTLHRQPSGGTEIVLDIVEAQTGKRLQPQDARLHRAESLLVVPAWPVRAQLGRVTAHGVPPGTWLVEFTTNGGHVRCRIDVEVGTGTVHRRIEVGEPGIVVGRAEIDGLASVPERLSVLAQPFRAASYVRPSRHADRSFTPGYGWIDAVDGYAFRFEDAWTGTPIGFMVFGKDLLGFTRVEVQPGDEARVTVRLHRAGTLTLNATGVPAVRPVDVDFRPEGSTEWILRRRLECRELPSGRRRPDSVHVNLPAGRVRWRARYFNPRGGNLVTHEDDAEVRESEVTVVEVDCR
jgi:RNA polymerase sigma-70 factor (ECF subfamily)